MTARSIRRRPARASVAAIVIVLVAGLGVASATSAGAVGAPANDNVEHAATISGTHGSVNGTILGATAQPGEPTNQGVPPTHSVWYAYTPTEAGTLTVDTCANTNFFSAIAVFTGASIGALAPVATHSNGACSQTRVAFNVVRSTTYRIAVDDQFGDPGSFTLAWTFTPAFAPLIDFGSDPQLNCFPKNAANDWLQFFSTTSVIPTAYSCATLVSVPGVGVFGPPNFAGTDGRLAGRTLLPYAPVSQSITAHRVRTTVALPGTALTLVQTETYERGTSMRVDVDVVNHGSSAENVVVYRTGDCFRGDDISFAIASAGSVGCEQALERGIVARPSPGDIFIRFQPLAVRRNAIRARSAAGDVSTIRSAVATGSALTNTCTCRVPVDAAAALSWSLPVRPHGTLSVSHILTMSTGSGRERTALTGALRSEHGHLEVTARVSTRFGPVRGAGVVFERGSLPACTAFTDRDGRATCRVGGHPDSFTATYFGDPTHRPSSSTFGPVDLGSRTRPGFPACAQFDARPSAIAEAVSGDGHYQLVEASTLAPPCPGVLYRAVSRGVVIGEARGDLRRTDLFGAPVAGFVDLYLDDHHASGCIVLESVDLRTGAVVDKVPSATSGKSCLDEVAGQKFR